MNNKKHVSLKDLAEELGVSVSTVSRALKDSPEVGEEMRERVKKLAGEWNYRPNPFAISLLKNKSAYYWDYCTGYCDSFLFFHYQWH